VGWPLRARRMSGWDRPHLVLFDVSTLYFETDAGTGSASRGSPRNAAWSRRSPSGCSRMRPGFPLMVEAFEGNRAETTTMLPTIQAFMTAHPVARHHDRGGRGNDLSGQQRKRSSRAGLSFILGVKIADIPHMVREWRDGHPGEQMPDGLILTQPWPAGPADKRR